MSEKYIEIDGKMIKLTRFADVINSISKERGINQGTIAESITNLDESRPLKSDVARQYVNRIINYKTCPSTYRAKKIMKCLNIDVDFILNYEIPADIASKAYKSGMERIEKIFRESDSELIEHVVSYAEFLYSR